MEKTEGKEASVTEQEKVEEKEASEKEEEKNEEVEALAEEEATLAEKEIVEAEEAEKVEEEETAEGEIVEEERPRIREEIPEEEIVEERMYTIPLREAWRSPRKNRVPRAIRLIRSFIQRHMKIGLKVGLEEEEGRLIISNEVNEWVWRRGIEKPPRKVRVKAVKDKDGNVTVYLAEGD